MDGERDHGPEPAWSELGDVARALGNERRRAVLDALIGAPTPLLVADLVERLGFHHLSVREHLAVLRDAGLVIEEVPPATGPGRPPHTYRPVPGALDRWTDAGPHAELAAMLLEVVAGRAPRDVGRDVGRRLAAAAAAHPGAAGPAPSLGPGGSAPGAAAPGGSDADPLDRLDAVTRRLGFEPRRLPGDDGLELELHRCPFIDLATANPGVVCELHRGIADGVAEGDGSPSRSGPGLRVRGLTLGDPPHEPCRLVLERTPGPGPGRGGAGAIRP